VIINAMRVNAVPLLVGVAICISVSAGLAADGPLVPAGNTAACEGAATCPAAGPVRLTAADYDRAARVLDSNLRGKVRNAVVAPRWISGGDVFWYRRDGADGPEYVIVDARTGSKTPAFDMARLAAAASQAAGGTPTSPRDLSVVKIDGDSEPRNVVLTQGDRGNFACALPGYACTFTQAVETPADGRRSPDRSQAVFARDDDLWIRDLKSGAERRLTTDGQPYFSYGKQPDSSLVAVPRLRSPVASPPWGVSWSPNGRTIVGVRIDERSVPSYPYVEWVPQDGSFRPITYQLRLPLLGDSPPPHDYFLLDAASGTKQEIKLPAGWSFASIAWSSDGRRMFGLAWSFGSRDAALVEVDANTGETRTIVKESSPTSLSFNAFVYNIANVRILGDGREAVWWSERDGWGHLYLYDIATGELRRQITSGPWLVRDIIRVDQGQREVYFTATGREPGEDPYYRHLYRVSLDGGAPLDLTPGDADHAFEAPLTGFAAAFLGGATDDGQKVSPSGRYVVDTYTTVDESPVTVLRATASTDIVTMLEQADASAVYAAGWRSPGAPVGQSRGWPHRHQRRRLSAAPTTRLPGGTP
jgi:dipeptidyl-peptidase-4